MTKHTKGPWTVLPRETYKQFGNEGFYKIEGYIADSDVQEYRVANVIDANDNPENEANAHLIAAAPELLEALSDLLRDEKVLDDDSPRLEATRSKARKAIAKATGEA